MLEKVTIQLKSLAARSSTWCVNPVLVAKAMLSRVAAVKKCFRTFATDLAETTKVLILLWDP